MGSVTTASGYLEVQCRNLDCWSCVPNAYGAGEHFYHHQLVERASNSVPVCPVCGNEAEILRSAPQEQKFALGEMLFTPAISALIPDSRDDAYEAAKALEQLKTCLRRHAQGDWGDVCAEDKRANDQACKPDLPSSDVDEPRERVLNRTRVLSAYQWQNATIWVITEAGRHSTTVMLPHEY